MATLCVCVLLWSLIEHRLSVCVCDEVQQAGGKQILVSVA